MTTTTEPAVEYDFEQIVEFSFQSRQQKFVVRFRDATTYIVAIDDLPKRLKTKNPDWENATLSDDKCSLVVVAKGEERIIPAHLLHAHGKSIK